VNPNAAEQTLSGQGEHPHRRRNALTGEWVLVSPHRCSRPWRGKREAPAQPQRPSYDPGCFLCPGNTRAGGALTPAYQSTFVFDNDFAALLPESPAEPSEHPLLERESEAGCCRVICFSPRHDLTLAEMAAPEIEEVVTVWAQQSLELGRRYRWVQVFENKGEQMGCSAAHPHGQIWAGTALPNEPSKEDAAQRAYRAAEKRPLLLDYVELEASRGERVVVEEEGWLAVVPWWANWPFETLLLPRRHVLRFPDLDTRERRGLARILKRLLVRYDNLFQCAFPYSMGWHGAPFVEEDCSHWQLHAHFYPPLLRSSEVRKFAVGYEMLAEAQRDLTPEQAALRLRQLPEEHYRAQSGASL